MTVSTPQPWKLISLLAGIVAVLPRKEKARRKATENKDTPHAKVEYQVKRILSTR